MKDLVLSVAVVVLARVAWAFPPYGQVAGVLAMVGLGLWFVLRRDRQERTK